MEIYVSVLKHRFAILILNVSNCDFAFCIATVVVGVWSNSDISWIVVVAVVVVHGGSSSSAWR